MFFNLNQIFIRVMGISENLVRKPIIFNIDVNGQFTGVTETLHLSSNRLSRLQLHLDRWSEPMSIAIQLNEAELPSVLHSVFNYTRDNIRWSFYVTEDSPDNKCFYIQLNGTKIYYDSCYECNILRSLAIESITTSHFMIIDADGILSSIAFGIYFISYFSR